MTDGRQLRSGVVDAHVHVVCPSRTQFPIRPTGVGTEWWQGGGDPDDLVEALDRAEVDAAVIVQAVGVYGYDCSCAIAVTARHAERFGLVVAIDMNAQDPVAELGRWAAETSFAGVRLFGVGAEEEHRWLTDGRGAAVWEAAAGMGLVLVPTIFTDQMGALRSLIEAQPSVLVALDHCGFPDLGGAGAEATVLAMADLAPLHLKVTSHNLHAAPDPAALLEDLIGAFGADRICWGSDYPQHDSLNYTEMLDLAHRAARRLSATDRDAFLGGTSRKLWWPRAER